MELNRNFKEFIELLNEHKVKYLVIGGYAVNFHGYPRYTRDIDFWIWMEKENIENLLQVIDDFGFESIDLKIENFFTQDNIIQLGFEPNRIDLLVSVDGVDFQECYHRKIAIELDNVLVNFLSIEDLITSKKTVARLQDLADAEQLEKMVKLKQN
jgi:predicted nucleotidyltransferase